MSGRRKRLARALKSASPKQVARRAAKKAARKEKVRLMVMAANRLAESLDAWDKFVGWCSRPGGYSWYI